VRGSGQSSCPNTPHPAHTDPPITATCKLLRIHGIHIHEIHIHELRLHLHLHLPLPLPLHLRLHLHLHLLLSMPLSLGAASAYAASRPPALGTPTPTHTHTHTDPNIPNIPLYAYAYRPTGTVCMRSAGVGAVGEGGIEEEGGRIEIEVYPSSRWQIAWPAPCALCTLCQIAGRLMG
jgi:hypothetical protein